MRGSSVVASGARLAASCAPIARVSASAKLGACVISPSNVSRLSRSSSVSRRARADAERTPSPSSASSPSTSPRRSTRISTSGGPSSMISTRPLRRMYRQSAPSPRRSTQSPALTCTDSTCCSIRASSSSSRPASSWTLRSSELPFVATAYPPLPGCARKLWGAFRLKVRWCARSSTVTNPSATWIRVPAHSSSVNHFVPRTAADA